MPWTDDPVADFHRHDAMQQKRLEELPKCSECGEPIQSDCYYNFDGYFYCEECLGKHRKWTENYID